MHGKRRVSSMKGKKRKLTYLPEGAKAKKQRRRPNTSLTTAVSNESENSQGTTLMLYDNETLIKRALETPVKAEVSKTLRNYPELIKDVQQYYLKFLHDYYRRLDNGNANAKTPLFFYTLDLAILACHIDHGLAKDIISPLIKDTTMENVNTQETTTTTNDTATTELAMTPADMQKRMSLSRNIAMLSSASVSVVAGAAEMLIKGEVGSKQIIKTALTSIGSAGVTSIAMNAIDKKGNYKHLTSGAIGAGVGLAVSGTTFALDSFFGNEETAEG